MGKLCLWLVLQRKHTYLNNVKKNSWFIKKSDSIPHPLKSPSPRGEGEVHIPHFIMYF